MGIEKGGENRTHCSQRTQERRPHFRRQKREDTGRRKLDTL